MRPRPEDSIVRYVGAARLRVIVVVAFALRAAELYADRCIAKIAIATTHRPTADDHDRNLSCMVSGLHRIVGWDRRGIAA